jgi:hypothetical protein
MGNNGADVLGTALQNAYASAYILLPANAIFAGSAAGWYYCSFSSTTALTVFNNPYTAGQISVPAVPTPFISTGPGAYAGVTGAKAGPTIPILGNTLGPNGYMRLFHLWNYLNSAGSKQITASFGGTTLFQSSATTSASADILNHLWVRGNTGKGVGPPSGASGPGLGQAGIPVYSSVDTTVDQNFILQGNLATATDYMVLEGFILEVIPGISV